MYQASLPMPLYKATKSGYADNFFDTGEMRLGTIWDFRQLEHGFALGDEWEGIRSHRFTHQGIAVVAGAVVKDSFVFCMSHNFDRNRFRHDGYDAAYRIDSLEFFEEIGRVVPTTIPIYGSLVHQVMYTNDYDEIAYIKKRISAGYERHRLNPPVGLLKPKPYSYQNEVRAIFEPVESVNLSLYDNLENGFSVQQFYQQKTIKSLLQPIHISAPKARRFTTRLF